MKPARLEIDYRTIRLVIGVIAISLGPLTSVISGFTITSISASYHEDGFARNIFVGFLFAIAAFLLAYNGRSALQMVLAKVAAVAAVLVALFPCHCGEHEEIVPYLHYIAAAVMFLILAIFCWFFIERARKKSTREARQRVRVYIVCGVLIVTSIVFLAADPVFQGALSRVIPRFVYVFEALGLISFGVAWLTASCTVPGLAGPGERHSLSPSAKPCAEPDR